MILFSTCWDRPWMWINSSLVELPVSFFCEETFDHSYFEMRASRVAQLVKNLPAMQETPFNSWVRKFPCRRDRLPTPVFLGFPGGSYDRESACNVGDLGSILGLGRSPGGRYGNPVQYSWQENPYRQRSLVGCSPWGHRVGHGWVTECSTSALQWTV